MFHPDITLAADWAFLSPPTSFVSCNGPCAPKEKCHRKEHIIIIIIAVDVVVVVVVIVIIMSSMIFNNQDIRGMKLKEKTIILSQFADGTTLFLEGSERSLVQAIRTLQKYARWSQDEF